MTRLENLQKLQNIVSIRGLNKSFSFGVGGGKRGELHQDHKGVFFLKKRSKGYQLLL